METNRIICGDALAVLKTLPPESVDTVITSPPYWGLRNYGVDGQLGLESSIQEYLDHMLEITAQCFRVLKSTGTLWWNHGDSYAGGASGISGIGSTLNGGKKTQTDFAKAAGTKGRRAPGIPNKSLTLQAHRLAIRMIDEQGWLLRNTLIWYKPNVMPTSAKDRFTVDFEPVFFFAKSASYYFKSQKEPVAQVSIERAKYAFRSKKANMNGKISSTGISVEGMGSRFVPTDGRNKRAVWKIPTSGSKYEHVAMFPEALVRPFIDAGTPPSGIILDPFMGAGTTAVVAKKMGCQYIGIELNPEYIKIAEERIEKVQVPMF